MLDKLKAKIPGMGGYYNQKALIWRNRGDSTALEIIDAVRIKYPDKPNRHELSTGEVIPAVPKDYVQNMFGGGSYFCAVEGSDDQLVIFKPKFQLDKVDEQHEPEERDVEIDSKLEGDKIKDRLIDKNYSAVNFSVLDNRDERFTFLSSELETADDKYGVSGLIWENKDAVLLMTAAVAVAIVMYTMSGDIVPAVKNLAEQMAQFNSNIQNLERVLNQTAPPGR